MQIRPVNSFEAQENDVAKRKTRVKPAHDRATDAFYELGALQAASSRLDSLLAAGSQAS